jgi:hypothetical protein
VLPAGSTLAPVFLHRSQVVAGPWFRNGACPCAACLHIRLGALERYPAAYESVCEAADSAPELFEERLPLLRGRSSLGPRIATAVATHLTGVAPEHAGSLAFTVDLRTGRTRTPRLLSAATTAPHAHAELLAALPEGAHV